MERQSHESFSKEKKNKIKRSIAASLAAIAISGGVLGACGNSNKKTAVKDTIANTATSITAKKPNTMPSSTSTTPTTSAISDGALGKPIKDLCSISSINNYVTSIYKGNIQSCKDQSSLVYSDAFTVGKWTTNYNKKTRTYYETILDIIPNDQMAASIDFRHANLWQTFLKMKKKMDEGSPPKGLINSSIGSMNLVEDKQLHLPVMVIQAHPFHLQLQTINSTQMECKVGPYIMEMSYLTYSTPHISTTLNPGADKAYQILGLMDKYAFSH